MLGAGYISVEFSEIMQGLGTQVTHLIRGERPLRGFDRDIQDGVYEGMLNHGINVIPEIQLLELKKTKKGIKVVYTQAGEIQKFSVDPVLSALG